jgi:hypothetical protein
MTARDDQGLFGSTLVRSAALVAIAVAITVWIFSRAGTPFAGYDWIELEGFKKHFYRDALLAGHLPLWNPYVGLGRPFLADIDTATLNPPNLAFLLPDAWALPMCVALHTVLILAGACLLGRDLDLNWRASLLAGVTFALGATLTARLQAGQIQVFCTFAYLPLWWALGWQAWREPAWCGMVAFAATTAMVVLAGSPPLMWAMSWVLTVWLVAWATGQPWRPTLRGALTVLVGGVAGLGLAAVQLVPFFELVQQGNRPMHDPAFANLGARRVRGRRPFSPRKRCAVRRKRRDVGGARPPERRSSKRRNRRDSGHTPNSCRARLRLRNSPRRAPTSSGVCPTPVGWCWRSHGIRAGVPASEILGATSCRLTVGCAPWPCPRERTPCGSSSDHAACILERSSPRAPR